MKRKCIEIEEMLAVLELPPDHARRRHLETCPRCAARLVSLRSFLDLAELPAGADIEDADRRLREAVHSRITGADVSSAATRRPGALSRALSTLRRRPWSPVLAAAVLVLVVLGIRTSLFAPDELTRPRVLRGQTEPSGLHPILAAPVRLPGGELQLSWSPVERAESYLVVIYRADMSEFARYQLASEDELLLDGVSLEALVETADPLFWRVIALRGRDQIASSPVRVLALPETP